MEQFSEQLKAKIRGVLRFLGPDCDFTVSRITDKSEPERGFGVYVKGVLFDTIPASNVFWDEEKEAWDCMLS